MRHHFLAVLVLALLAEPVRAQEEGSFDWSTSVIHRLSGTVQVAEHPVAAASQPATLLPESSLSNSLDELQSGSSISVDFQNGMEELVRSARRAGVYVIAEVDAASVDAEDAAAAVRSGLTGFIVHGEASDIAAFQKSLNLSVDDPPHFAAFASGVPDLETEVREPPSHAFVGKPDWDSVYAAADYRGIMHIRADQPEILHALMLAPGGLYLEGDVDEAAAAIVSFRLRHPAVGAGSHEPLVNSLYTFRRSLLTRNGRDDVVVVLGAEGKTSINVSRVFADDTLLRDAMTGGTAFVSFGMASFDSHPSGIVLIEEVH